jgi:hypothetical protein
MILSPASPRTLLFPQLIFAGVVVCTENLIRVYRMTESAKLASRLG